MTDVLGPLQPIWDAWTPAQDLVMEQPESHFAATIREQFYEMDEEGGLPESEIVDIISVALNWLRWHGYDEVGVAMLLSMRAKRYEGRTEEIFAKYRGILDPEDIR